MPKHADTNRRFGSERGRFTGRRRRLSASDRRWMCFEALEARRLLAIDMVTSDLDDGGAGTLRAVIAAAAAGDTIEFQAGISTVDLTQGQLAITKNLTIAGTGASQLTIDQTTSNSTVVLVDTATTVTISDLTISGGKTTDVGPFAGGIYNSGVLTLNSCAISGNSSGFGGGGIWNAGNLTVNDSTFTNDSASESGGAIYNGGTATVTSTTFTANSAGFGGAIYNDPAGNLTVTDSTLSANTANRGGAIMDDFRAGGTLTVVGSTFASNSAVGDFAQGGAIDNEGTSAAIINSSFTGNSAPLGGAIDNDFGGTATLLNDTISGNSAATSGGGIYNTGGTTTSVASVANSIVAGNTVSAAGATDPDVYGNYAATDHDLIGIVGDATGFSGSGAMASLIGGSASPLDPKLGPLGDNGGPTRTMALLAGSPAIDAGDNGPPSPPFPALPATDQRMLSRIVNGTVDIGAFEYDVSTPVAVDATAAGTHTATEGESLTATLATFTDPNGAGALTVYTALVDWGDGSGSSTAAINGPDTNGMFTVVGTHTYAGQSVAPQSVTVVIERAGAPDSTVTDTVNLADGPLSLTTAQIEAQPNAPFSGAVATFVDPGGPEPPAAYSATVDWGDGSAATAGVISGPDADGVFTISGSHAYTATGTPTAAITVDHMGVVSDVTVTDAVSVSAPPTLSVQDDVYVVGSGTVSVSAANGVLANDTGPSRLTVTSGMVRGANGGTFSLNADGSFTYTPGSNFPGFDYAQYTVQDAEGDTASATVNVLSQTGAIVWKFYEQVLGRNPDYSGLRAWINDIANGGKTGDIAAGFFESTELLTKTIAGYYQQYLLRVPDSAGVAYWIAAWRATGEPEGIRAGFAGSSEFYGSAGGTPNGWITALYDRILNRAPDDAGEQFWLNAYASETGAGVDPMAARREIALDFLRSAEERDDDVTGWYREYLFHDPSAADLQASFAQLEVGASDRTIEQEITNSQEYAASPPQPASGAAAALPNYIELEAQANRQQGARPGAQTNNQALAQPSATIAAKDALFSNLGGS